MKLHMLSRYFWMMLSAILISNAANALPFSITPASNTPFPTTMVSGTTVFATYTVQNRTNTARQNNYIKYLPPNVTALQNGCGSTFSLAAYGQAGDSCNLNLVITGAVVGDDPTIHNHLFICFPGGITCAGTAFPLNVSVLSNIGVSGINALAHLDTIIFAGGLNSSSKGNLWGFLSNTWSSIFSGATSSPVEAIVTSADNLIYFGGQVYNAGQFYSAWVYQYDASEKITIETGFMSSTSATKLNSLVMNASTVYAAGIDSTGAQGQAWRYDSGVWASLAISDTTITEVRALTYSPVQAFLFDAVVNNGAATTSKNPYAQVQYYNGTTWTDTGLPTSDAGLYLVTLNTLAVDNVGVVYAGGIDSNQQAAVWKYAGSTWTALAAPSALTQSQIYSLAFNSNDILFAGGFDGNIGQVWYYNTGSNTWTNMNLAGSTLVQTITIDSNDLLYAGGLAQNNLSGIWSMSADVS